MSGKLLSAKQVAELIGCSVRQVRRLDTNEEMPQPTRIGRMVRWVEDEIEAWVHAGCPHRRVWDAMQQAKGGAR